MSLSRSEYKAITRTKLGQELRGIFMQATNDPRDRPSVSQIQESLRDAGVPESHHNDVIIRVRKLAKRRAEGGGTELLELRGEADRLTVKTLRELRAGDDLLGEDGLEPDPDHRETEAIGNLADAIRHRDTSEPLLDEPIRFDDGSEVRL